MRTIVFLSLFGVALGCGPHTDGGFPLPPSGRFLGTWVYASGSSTTTCDGMPATSADQTGKKVTFAAVFGSDLVITDGNGCTIRFTVSGDTASANPNQTCDFSQTQSGVTVSAHLVITSATFSTRDGVTMTMADTGTSVSNFPGGMMSCSASGSGTLTKSN